MRHSISQIFNFNIFGIPVTGADVCGYGGVNPSEELCAKWMQVGTLYPFARQHSHISNSRKEPWQFGDTMLETSRKSLAFRYKMLKFYYSLFLRSQNKGTIFKPVFFEFSDDKELLDTAKVYNYQFMIGSELLAIPNLEEGKEEIAAYFPKGNWFDMRNDEIHLQGSRNISAKMNDTAPVFIRGGKTIFMQNTDNVENSFDLKDDIELIVALDDGHCTQTSEGFVPALNDYNNKQKVEACLKNDCNIKIHTTYNKENNELKVKIHKSNYADGDFTALKLTKIKVYGVDSVTRFNNHYTSRLKQNNKYIVRKIKTRTLNEHTIEFKFPDSILFNNEEIDISIQFI